MIKSGIFFSCLLFISCNASKHSGNSKNIMPGTWQSTPIVIDGDNKDWPSPYPNYDSKAKVAYATSNDAENLYVTLETGDEMTQVKILKQGMTLLIDTGGKKDAGFSINFPLQNGNESIDMIKQDLLMKENRGSLMKRQSDERIMRLSQQANQMTLEGFAGCSGGFVISQTTPCGIKVSARIDAYKELVWEAVIPFKVLYNKDSISGADAGHPISICYSIKGFKASSPKNANNASTTGTNDGMGGAGRNSAMQGGGGGVPQGGSHRVSYNDPYQHLYESTKTWKQFSIVRRP